MQRKLENFHKYWHNDQWIEDHVVKAEKFDYEQHVNELKPFLDEHPEVMKERIEEKNWKFNYDISFNRKSLKDKLKEFLHASVGTDFSYKNYKIAKLGI